MIKSVPRTTHNKSLKRYYIFFPPTFEFIYVDNYFILFILPLHTLQQYEQQQQQWRTTTGHTQFLQSDFVVKICFHSLLLPDGATGVLGTMMTKPSRRGVNKEGGG